MLLFGLVSNLVVSPAWETVNHFLVRLYSDAVDSGSFRHCCLTPRGGFILVNLHECEVSFGWYYKLIPKKQW